MLGGLYALFAAGLSLIFGIMRLVNLAHGDLIVLAAFVVLALTQALGIDPFLGTLLAMPLLFAFGYALQHVLLNRTLGRDILPPLLVTFGLSIIIQNGLLEVFSADSQRLNAGAIETASIQLGGGIAVGTIQLITLGFRRRRDPGAQPSVLSHRARPRLPRHLRRSRDRPADGHRQPPHLLARHGGGDGGDRGRPRSISACARTSIPPSGRRACSMPSRP